METAFAHKEQGPCPSQGAAACRSRGREAARRGCAAGSAAVQRYLASLVHVAAPHLRGAAHNSTTLTPEQARQLELRGFQNAKKGFDIMLM